MSNQAEVGFQVVVDLSGDEAFEAAEYVLGRRSRIETCRAPRAGSASVRWRTRCPMSDPVVHVGCGGSPMPGRRVHMLTSGVARNRRGLGTSGMSISDVGLCAASPTAPVVGARGFDLANILAGYP